MKSLKFTAEKKDSKFKVIDYQYEKYISNLKDGKYILEIKKYYKKRTKAQNRWYWFVLGIIGDDLGYSTEELHMAFKATFLTELIGDLIMPQSTTSLTTLEMNEYWEKIYRWAAKEGIYIPDPKSDPNSY